MTRIVCPVCGNDVREDWSGALWCRECGEPVEDDAPDEEEDAS